VVFIYIYIERERGFYQNKWILFLENECWQAKCT
jgi:hypothetical protein